MANSLNMEGMIMAKKEEQKYKYPSRFASHASMVDPVKTEELGSVDKVVCTDEYGDYVTYRNRLDTGEVDQIRADGRRVKYEKEVKK